MDPVIKGRHRGSTLVFALLALIAVMAIGVVLISRAGRDEAAAPPAVDASAPTASDDDLTSLSATSEQDTATTGAQVQPTPVTFPPPPPPPSAATPDPKTLPPEG